MLIKNDRFLLSVLSSALFLFYTQSFPLYAQESINYTLHRKGRCIPSIPFDSESGEVLGMHWRDGEIILPSTGVITHRSDANIIILTKGYAPGTCVEVSLEYNDSEWTVPFEYRETHGYAHGFVDSYGRVLIRDALLYYDGWIN